jgi:hypothetical protein
MKQRIYKAKYLAPTEHKGARVKLVNLDNLEAKIIPYNYQFNNAKEVASNYINSGLNYFVYDTFWDDDTSYVYLLTKQK